MPANAIIGLKPESDPRPLVELATSVLQPGAAVHLVSFVRVGVEGDEHQRLDETRKVLDEVAEELRGAGYQPETFVQVSAVAPGSELAQIAQDMDADLIVIGLAKRSRVGKALLGSDAQSVLLSAHCPVLSARVT